eukprot:TRINITY_DN4998_c0_g1_i1.p1 TRINITY_DN4998_c0_g1~~TRINITY_DN4998_c0_g1_i1.p1  ORF type:complete len:277 (+),score=38.44 TRINITY_DN4998_c0_g1_i1:65-895(+)
MASPKTTSNGNGVRLGVDVLARGLAYIRARRGGAGAASRRRAWDGEREVDTSVVPQSATPEPRSMPRAGCSASVSVEPESLARPSGHSSSSSGHVHAPLQRFVQAAPRVRQVGSCSSSSSCDAGAVFGEASRQDTTASIEEASTKAVNARWRQYDVLREHHDQLVVESSRWLGNAVTKNGAQQEPYGSSFETTDRSIAHLLVAGDDTFIDDDELEEKAFVDGFLQPSFSGYPSAGSTITTTVAVHYPTLLKLPDVDEFSDDSSDEDMGGLNDVDAV